MKFVTILGTRPEIIKMSPLIKELESRKIENFVIHTGQHYDFSMDKIFFNELNLNPKMINLNVGSGSHGEITAKMIIKIEKILIREKPDVVLVQGDTNTVLAGALTCTKLNIPVAHIEAGLRSFDRRMPEEYNRVMCDHISDYLFPPTKLAEKNLLDEGISKKQIIYNRKISNQKIFLTGNPIVDVIYQNLERANNSDILSKLNLNKGEYFLLTAHRQENVDNKDNLMGIIKGISKVSDYFKLPIIYPIHPRTKKRLTEFNLIGEINKIKNLEIIEPLGFIDLLALESNAKLILTDSGGIQEEACSLKVPCVVLRDNSDRPESLEVNASLLSGCDPNRILESAIEMLNRERNWENPFGNGKSSEKTINILIKEFQR